VNAIDTRPIVRIIVAEGADGYSRSDIAPFSQQTLVLIMKAFAIRLRERALLQ